VTQVVSGGPAVTLACIVGPSPGQPGKLVLIDVSTGRRIDDGTPEQCRQPVLSPDGRFVAVEMGGDLALASVADPGGTLSVLAPTLPADTGAQTFRFDATGNWIAVAVPNGVLILPTSASVGTGRRIGLPPGLEPAHLVWSETGHTLALTARTSDGSPVAVWCDGQSGQILGTSSGRAVLAVPHDDEVWTTEPADGRPAAQASVLSRSGIRPGVFVCPPDRMILGWLPRRQEVMLCAFAEDAGDDVDIVLAPAGGGDARPLIQGVQGVRALSASCDGTWVAMLIDEDPLAVALMATGDGNRVRVPVPFVVDDSDDRLAVTEIACASIHGSKSW